MSEDNRGFCHEENKEVMKVLILKRIQTQGGYLKAHLKHVNKSIISIMAP
jgi:hypothetical protein